MNPVENSLTTELDAVFDPPLFCYLAQCSDEGPRVSPLWFLWDDGALWSIAPLEDRSYPGRVEQDSRAAIAIVDFDPASGRVGHVGMRGHATLEPFDEGKAVRLLKKYSGEKNDGWPDRFVELDSGGFRLIKVVPETVIARDQSYPVSTRFVD